MSNSLSRRMAQLRVYVNSLNDALAQVKDDIPNLKQAAEVADASNPSKHSPDKNMNEMKMWLGVLKEKLDVLTTTIGEFDGVVREEFADEVPEYRMRPGKTQKGEALWRFGSKWNDMNE
ncbi:hypothetical protein LTR24_002156 [Lithohypha guttulata]|uniref:Uncharacterized protein n=1 Tax=Lithohypha guttulata TaxID=1690604 RepID=A0ABR0KIP2_9EURO|nr:hypothetical protein LTR24_002156 [Lithohypha guttulata]